MSKKVVKMVLISISVIIFLWIIDFMILKFTGYGPLLSAQEKNGDSKVYHAVFYTVWKCDVKEKPKDYVLKFFNKEFNCEDADVMGLKDNEYIIVDETKDCEVGAEEIARDDKFTYNLPCKQSETIFLKYGDGTKITLKEALATDKITIAEFKEEMPDKVYIGVIDNEE